MLQGRAPTLYCFRNHNIHVILDKSFKDHLRRLQGWILVPRKRGSGFYRQVYWVQSIMMRCSSLCFSEQCRIPLVINFPSIIRNIENTGPAFRKWTVWKKREELFFHRRGDTLNFVYSLDNTRMNHLKVDRIRGLCSCTFVASEKEKMEWAQGCCRVTLSYITEFLQVSGQGRGLGGER